MNIFFQSASKIKALPVLGALAPSAAYYPDAEKKAAYLNAQRLAEKGAREIAGFIDEGWSEKQAARLLDTWLRDNGVKSFFHASFAWFGERTRFDHIKRKNYWEFLPTERLILPGEVFILDVAPIVDGFTCDIGYTSSLGENADLKKAKEFLSVLRKDIVEEFKQKTSGEAIWRSLDRKITDAGYDNIHKIYPYSVLGHRVHETPSEGGKLKILNFGWQSYWSLLSRGLFGQLLNENFQGDLKGIWAVEPHIGAKGFGAKFEELLVVDQDSVYWLEAEER